MADEFKVIPPELRGVSGDLGDISSRAKGAMSMLGDQLAGNGTPWGQFADGANGVSAQVHQVRAVVNNMTSWLDNLAGKLKQASDSSELSDGG